MERSIVAKETPRNQHFISASFPCKGHICRFFDMRITWFWLLIWDGSISGNVCLTEVSYPAKLHAFIIKRTILALNSRTNCFITDDAKAQEHPKDKINLCLTILQKKYPKAFTHVVMQRR